jgi:hypothetical protein
MLQGKYKGSGQICAKTRWEMSPKALGDHLSSRYLKGVGDSVVNVQRVLETFSAMLWEMPK